MRKRTKNARSANNAVFNKYIELLVEHERAIAQDDQEAADRIADEACDLNARFSYEENQWLHGLSGDLKLLSNRETFLPSNLSRQDVQQGAMLALERRDGETVLRLLRQAPFIKKEFLAYFRAQAYDMLGLINVAIEFMRYAVDHLQSRQEIMRQLLDMLNRAGLDEEMLHLALFSIRREDAGPGLLVYAAGMLFVATRGMNEEQSYRFFEEAMKSLEIVLDSPEKAASLEPNEYLFAVLVLASCYDRLNQTQAALLRYSEAISIAPLDPDAYALRGNLLMSTNEQAAIADYRKAVELGTRAIAPHLVLANEALKNSRFKEARALSLRALSLNINIKSRATALEFLAISSYEIGGKDRENSLSLLDEAISLDPDNERIWHNRAIMREQLSGKVFHQLASLIRHPEPSVVLQLDPGTGRIVGVPRMSISGLDQGVRRDIATPA